MQGSDAGDGIRGSGIGALKELQSGIYMKGVSWYDFGSPPIPMEFLWIVVLFVCIMKSKCDMFELGICVKCGAR